jgi:hypothetical protein
VLRKFLEAAAAAGPNKVARRAALKGQAKAIDKAMMGPPPSQVHPGSSAGLEAAPRVHLEMHGDGFGKYIRKTHASYTEMWLTAPAVHGMNNRLGMADYRNYRRRELDWDRRLSELL